MNIQIDASIVHEIIPSDDGKRKDIIIINPVSGECDTLVSVQSDLNIIIKDTHIEITVCK